MQHLIDLDFLKFSVPLFGAMVAWLANEYRKQKADDYQRKEERYIELLKGLRAFFGAYKLKDPKLRRQAFLDQLDQCWLYCPDEVIQLAYGFLNAITPDADPPIPEEEQDRALGLFVLAIRRDLFSHSLFRRTKLRPTDYISWTPI